MNYFNNNKLLMWVLLILLVLNISAIGTIIYHVYSDDRKTADAEISTEAPLFLKERMRLNDEQWNDIRQLHAEFRQDSREIFRELRQIRKEILEEVSMENPDREKLYELAEKYGEEHALLKKKTVDHFLGMKENISPEQDRLMNIFLRNMMEHEGMGPGQMRGPGNRERHRFRRENR